VSLRRGALRGLRGPRGASRRTPPARSPCRSSFIAVGEQYISSSLAAILVATMPLQLAVLALWLLPRRPAAGLGHRRAGDRGWAGSVALVGVDVGGRPNELWGAALVSWLRWDTPLPRIVSRHLGDLDPSVR